MAINEQFIESRYEIIDGETIMMSPRPTLNHNRVITNLAVVFDKYLDGKKCEYFTDGVDVHFDEKNRVIPDSMIVCNTDILKPNGIYGTPDLIVEVLSPSTARKDKGDKKTLYEKHGVKEYWIIDPVAKSIEVYLLKDDRYELDNVYTVIPDWDWEQMTEEEKKEAVLTFKVSLYDDFIIDIKDIFKNMVIY
ncbi:Uma2 family endonuclease [Metasolibacillus meyeri]|uniref:Uma2 family endonuclease n=1 Tax=Metasolibacillus meyeri TaxID=1071052 RepID=A0AAW9NNL1_9BACL|nr:Uma2 family endonuclease [Metasolibacillus meyeri]MEC1176904.1 Uma2 family endonuclease [Metasolibacillus meyeri]